MYFSSHVEVYVRMDFNLYCRSKGGFFYPPLGYYKYGPTLKPFETINRRRLVRRQFSSPKTGFLASSYDLVSLT
jgi:hypothetical protein